MVGIPDEGAICQFGEGAWAAGSVEVVRSSVQTGAKNPKMPRDQVGLIWPDMADRNVGGALRKVLQLGRGELMRWIPMPLEPEGVTYAMTVL